MYSVAFDFAALQSMQGKIIVAHRSRQFSCQNKVSGCSAIAYSIVKISVYVRNKVNLANFKYARIRGRRFTETYPGAKDT